MEQKLIENTRIEYVEDNENGIDPNLVFSFPNPLDEDEPQLRQIRLFTRDRNRQLSDEVISQTQDILRTNLNDDTITFAATPDEAEDTDIRNWVKEHKGEEINNVYQNGQYYQLGLNNGTSNFGGSKHLTNYNPDTATEKYDPTQHRMGVFNAQTDEAKEAMRNGDTTFNNGTVRIYKKRNGNVGVELNHVIHDVVLESANAFGAETDKNTRLDFLDEVIESYSIIKKQEPNKLSVEDVQEFRDKVAKEPHKYGYRALMEFIGGSTAPLLPKNVSSIAKDTLENSTRLTAALYIKNPETGIIYRSSRQTVRPDISGQNYNPNFLEFFAKDEARKDVVAYLSNFNIPDFDKVASEALKEVLKGKVSNLDNPDFGDVPTTMLTFMQHILNGREIRLISNLPKDHDYNRMGSYVTAIGEVSDINLDEIEVEQPTANIAENAFSNTDGADIKDEDLPFSNKSSESTEASEEKAEDDTNPFAPADNSDQESPFTTKKDSTEDKTNPFDV